MKRAIIALVFGLLLLLIFVIWQNQPAYGPRFEIVDFYGTENSEGSAWWWGGDCYKISFRIKNIGKQEATEIHGTVQVRDFARAKYVSGFRDKASHTQTWNLPQGNALEPGDMSQPIVIYLDEDPTIVDPSVSITVECVELVSQQFVKHLQP